MGKYTCRTRWSAAAIALTLLMVTTPTASAHHEDECAGGVDAGDDMGYPTEMPSGEYAGCTGSLYMPPGNSTSHHPQDLEDHYSLKVDGVGTAKIHFRLCNDGPGLLVYDINYKRDLLPIRHIQSYYVEPGNCTSEAPVEIEGQEKPGSWRISIWTPQEELPNGKSAPYDLYVQPLLR